LEAHHHHQIVLTTHQSLHTPSNTIIVAS